MSREHQKIEEVIMETIQTVTDGLPDGRTKSLVMTNLQQALLWVNAEEHTKKIKERVAAKPKPKIMW